MKTLRNATRSLIGCALLTLAATGFAQVTEEWVARYNGPEDSNSARALAVDTAGNVCVTGYSWGAGTNNDYATVKCDSNGNQLWVARYNGPGNSLDEARALAVDAAGNVYVTGYYRGAGTAEDYATIKYDSNGNQLWVGRYNGPGNYADYANSLAVDGAGNVYVTGWSSGAGTSEDYATIKYDSNGNQLWVARYNGPGNGLDIAFALAVDTAGNAYVTGGSVGAGTQGDYATVKYDSEGNQLWVARYNGPGDSYDSAAALVVDAAGNVYVTGNSIGTAYPDFDYATIKYDSNGNQLWVARYNGPGNSVDDANGLAVDAAGHVYVTGSAFVGEGTYPDYATIKYDPNGNQLWLARYNGPGNRHDGGNALAVDAAGSVYVAGVSRGAETSDDYATIKYDSNGNQLWLARYNGPGNDQDYAVALAVDGGGNVYVTGTSAGAGIEDYATIKYVQTSSVQPSRFTVLRGQLIGGGLSELVQSDNLYLTIQQRPSVLDDPNIQLVVQGTAPAETSAYFRFRLEAKCSALPSGNVPQRIELYNYQESRWEQVDERASTSSDSVVEVTFTENAQRFIQPGTKTIEARIGWFDRGVLAPNWFAAIDQTVWEIAP